MSRSPKNKGVKNTNNAINCSYIHTSNISLINIMGIFLLPGDNRDHSPAMFDGCADIFVNCNCWCEISGMKAETVSKFF